MATKPDKAAFAQRLKEAAVFRGLSDEALAAIAAQTVMRSLRAGQVLWKQGSHAYELAFVWEGELEVVRHVEGRVAYRAVTMNQMIGFSNAIGRAVCTVDVVAGPPTRLLITPGDVLRGLIPKFPEIAYRALSHMGDLLGRLSDEVEMLHNHSLEGRVVHRLRALAAGQTEVRITHQALADQVGARRESVTRTLIELEKRGMVTCHRGRIGVRTLGESG
jgi:CRP-like cAMP-binding protein